MRGCILPSSGRAKWQFWRVQPAVVAAWPTCGICSGAVPVLNEAHAFRHSLRENDVLNVNLFPFLADLRSSGHEQTQCHNHSRRCAADNRTACVDVTRPPQPDLRHLERQILLSAPMLRTHAVSDNVTRATANHRREKAEQWSPPLCSTP